MKDALGRYKRALLLGGGSEIGLAIVSELVRRHGLEDVILAGRRPSELEARLDAVGVPGRTEAIRFDATDPPRDHAAWVQELWDAHGDIDVVIFAFGQLGEQHETEQDNQLAVDLIRTNFVGGVSVGLPIADRLRAQGHGTMIFLSSVAGERTRPSNYIYGSSKAALDAFAQGLRRRHADSTPEIMIVRPGFVHSRMTRGLEPAPFAVDPERVARDASRGLRRGASTVYSPPMLRLVMSALRHLPEPVFQAVASREQPDPTARSRPARSDRA